MSKSLKQSMKERLKMLQKNEISLLYCFSEKKYLKKSRDDIYQLGDDQAIAMDNLITRGVLRVDATWDQTITESMLGREFIKYIKFLAGNNLASSSAYIPDLNQTKAQDYSC